MSNGHKILVSVIASFAAFIIIGMVTGFTIPMYIAGIISVFLVFPLMIVAFFYKNKEGTYYYKYIDNWFKQKD